MQIVARPHRGILAVLFGAGLLILLDQAADVLAALLARPVELGAPSWRFGLFGMLTSRASVLVVGDVMLFVAAAALGWRSTLRGLGVVHMLLAATVAVGLILFLLDALQVRATVPAQLAGAVSAAAARAGVVALAGFAALAWAGIAAWRATGKGHRRDRSVPAPLLVSERKDGPAA